MLKVNINNFVKIPDGANTVAIGQFGKVSDGNLAMIGGNCAIHGFDREGNDAYWTVTGDNISAMALVDIDNDGQNEVSDISKLSSDLTKIF